jgi:carbon-monoxide dehydrogenase catalytic subunit
VALVAEGGMGGDLSELPIAAAAPEAMSEKAITIGLYAVASGIFTAFTPAPRIAGSSVVRKYLEEDVEKETGGKFLFASNMDDAAKGILAHLDAKRKALKLAPRALTTYVPATGLKSLGCGQAQKHSQERVPEA